MYCIETIARCQSEDQCEQRVDRFLNDYCADATLTHTNERITLTTVTTQQTIHKTVISTVTRTVSPTCTRSPTVLAIHRQRAQPPSPTSEKETLGVPFGLFALLLVLVTFGWVYTCWIMKKKREVIKSTALRRYNS